MAHAVLGRMAWYELMTTNPAAAQRFYPHVTGWRTAPYEGMDPPYTLWMRADSPVGGVMELTEEMREEKVPPHWMLYVGTPDIAHTLRHAESLGAQTIVPIMKVEEVGRIAVLADPQGATFAVMQSLQPYPPEAPAALGEFSWHELATTDDEAALAFYTSLFGWEAAGTMDMGPMGQYRFFGRGGAPFGAVYRKPASMPAPPHWLLYVRVANVDAAIETVKAKGGRVLNGPEDVPGNRIAQCMDPQGAAFALQQTVG